MASETPASSRTPTPSRSHSSFKGKTARVAARIVELGRPAAAARS